VADDIVTRLLALNHPDAADGRASADRLAEAAEMAGPVLDDAAYREALHQARKTGGEAAAAGVRRAQRAARLRVAATPANAAAATTTVADDLNEGNTMSIKIDTNELLSLLGTDGEHWVQGKWGDDTAMCLHGAIRRCQPQPGDAHLIEQVAQLRGWGTDWNDDSNTGWAQVRDLIVAGIEVTDADLADTFGPQWEQVVALVRRAAVLTTDEINRLAAAWDAARDAAWAAARAAAWAAARDAAWDAAWAAARAAAWDAAWDAAPAAAWAAAQGLVIRDLIGHGFTQQHYDLLTTPWRTVIGPVYPDDEEADRD